MKGPRHQVVIEYFTVGPEPRVAVTAYKRRRVFDFDVPMPEVWNWLKWAKYDSEHDPRRRGPGTVTSEPTGLPNLSVYPH